VEALVEVAAGVVGEVTAEEEGDKV